MALADIPGYGAYIQRRQMNERAPLAQLEQVSGAVGLLAKLQQRDEAQKEAARQAEYQGAIAALPPDAAPEERIRIASKYLAPEKLATLQQGALDRKAQRDVLIQSAADRRDQNKALIDARYDQMTLTAGNEEQKRALEARRISEKSEADRRHDETLRLLGALKDKPRAPDGFRYNAAGDALEAIPGGPKDTAPKDLARAKGAVQKATTVIQAVDEALTQTGPFTTGLTGAVLGAIPGTPAYDLDGTLDTVKANLGFSELQAMRDASPTGGALGQVAIQELAMLQATLASLKRGLGRPKLESGLKKVRQHMENWRKAVAEANPEALAAPGGAGDTPAPAAPASPTAAPVQPLSPEEQAELDRLRKKHGR